MNITFEELMKEVEKHRVSKNELTKEQIKFLVACRGKDPVVAYSKMVGLWERAGWGKTSETTMRNIWQRYKRTQ